jgi:two-component sensor histidine kinase
MAADEPPSGLEQVLETPDLAVALESDWFKQFLDQLPVAIAISELTPAEPVVFVNAECARLTGRDQAALLGKSWESFPGKALAPDDARDLSRAVVDERDYAGVFSIQTGRGAVAADVWSNIIEDDDGTPAFRLVAFVENAALGVSLLDELHARVREKDTQLKELQHRVKNNLQMITALIRVEARGVTDLSTGEGFDRLAGRVEALGLLYRSLAEAEAADAVDLGVYLSEIASAVMRAHATEGIRLDLKVDTWPVSIDVAMPAGLVANELLTNALKHAFEGREGGTIMLHSTTRPEGCRVVIADDGVGLPAGALWPKPGKLSALIVRSLEQNAKARIDVHSEPGKGVRVTIDFSCEDAAPNTPSGPFQSRPPTARAGG